MAFPKQVKLVEVSPRDGLQNESNSIPTELKIELINRLSETGLTVIEATSFVSPKWVPQLADHTEVLQGITHHKNIHYPVLVPNQQGLQAALSAGAQEIAVFTAATNTFTQKNTNCSIAESLQRIEEIIKETKPLDIPVRGYISCVLGCPYEGKVTPEQVLPVALQLWQMGCYEISLGDTIGVGTANQAQQLIKYLQPTIPIEHLAIHFHDTYGQALANIYACLELGVATIDCSVAGLGGCPYAPGAGGNVATEDVLYLLNGLGIKTGVDLKQLIQAGRLITDYLKRPPQSKVAKALAS